MMMNLTRIMTITSISEDPSESDSDIEKTSDNPNGFMTDIINPLNLINPLLIETSEQPNNDIPKNNDKQFFDCNQNEHDTEDFTQDNSHDDNKELSAVADRELTEVDDNNVVPDDDNRNDIYTALLTNNNIDSAKKDELGFNKSETVHNIISDDNCQMNQLNKEDLQSLDNQSKKETSDSTNGEYSKSIENNALDDSNQEVHDNCDDDKSLVSHHSNNTDNDVLSTYDDFVIINNPDVTKDVPTDNKLAISEDDEELHENNEIINEDDLYDNASQESNNEKIIEIDEPRLNRKKMNSMKLQKNNDKISNLLGVNIDYHSFIKNKDKIKKILLTKSIDNS